MPARKYFLVLYSYAQNLSAVSIKVCPLFFLEKMVVSHYSQTPVLQFCLLDKADLCNPDEDCTLVIYRKEQSGQKVTLCLERRLNKAVLL